MTFDWPLGTGPVPRALSLFKGKHQRPSNIKVNIDLVISLAKKTFPFCFLLLHFLHCFQQDGQASKRKIEKYSKIF
jgi:hypothetical protein